MRRSPTTLLLAALVLAAVPSPAAAVTKSFYGMNWDRQFSRDGRGDVLTREFPRMRSAGVRSVRVVFSWAEAQRAENAPFDFAQTEELVAEAARRELDLLPIILSTPPWARKYPDREGSPPRNTEEPMRFLEALVDRYGPNGRFWLQNPTLPKRPIREWQIWNEPELRSYWNEKRFWKGYSSLVRAADATLRRVDRGARLVLAGLTGYSWKNLNHLYESGVKGHFDAAAVHPYTGSPEEVARIVKRNRAVMARWRDANRALWITELSWPASKGRMQEPDGLRRVVTSDRGMAKRLREAYRYFRSTKNPRHRVGRVYWYTWASTYSGDSDVFDYAGLGRMSGGQFEPKPALEAYDDVAP
jgi:hypothetical protein